MKIETPKGWRLVPVGENGRCLLTTPEIKLAARRRTTHKALEEWRGLEGWGGWGVVTGPSSGCWLGPEAGATWQVTDAQGEVRWLHAGNRPPPGAESRLAIVPVAEVVELEDDAGLGALLAKVAKGDPRATRELAKLAGGPRAAAAWDSVSVSAAAERWASVAWPTNPAEVDTRLAGPALAEVADRWSNLLGVSPTVALTAALSGLSTTLAGRVEIRCGGDGWWERNPSVWALDIMASGVRKSPLLELVLRPWLTQQARARDKWRIASREHRMLVHEAEQAMKGGRKDGADLDEEEALDILDRPAPWDPKLITSDFSPEGLDRDLSVLPAVYLASDEAEEFFASAARGDTIKLGPLLKGYSGAYVLGCSRIGRRGQVASDSRRRAGLLGLCQPAVLYGAAANREFLDQGLLGRALWAVSLDPAPMDEDLLDSRAPNAGKSAGAAWERLVGRGFELPQVERLSDGTDNGEPAVWSMCARGERALLRYADECKRRSGLGGDLHDLQTWLLKAHGHAARLAATLALAGGGLTVGGEIPLATVEAAIALVREYEGQARAAWQLAGWPPATDDARHLWARFGGFEGQGRVPIAAVDRLVLPGPEWSPARVDGALEILESRGFVELTRPKGSKRRPATVEINPLAR